MRPDRDKVTRFLRQNRTKVGLKHGPPGSAALDVVWQNQTKVGLKQPTARRPCCPKYRQNRTKVGLKLSSTARCASLQHSAKSNQGGIETRVQDALQALTEQGKIEPRWDLNLTGWVLLVW